MCKQKFYVFARQSNEFPVLKLKQLDTAATVCESAQPFSKK